MKYKKVTPKHGDRYDHNYNDERIIRADGAFELVEVGEKLYTSYTDAVGMEFLRRLGPEEIESFVQEVCEDPTCSRDKIQALEEKLAAAQKRDKEADILCNSLNWDLHDMTKRAQRAEAQVKELQRNIEEERAKPSSATRIIADEYLECAINAEAMLEVANEHIKVLNQLIDELEAPDGCVAVMLYKEDAEKWKQGEGFGRHSQRERLFSACRKALEVQQVAVQQFKNIEDKTEEKLKAIWLKPLPPEDQDDER